MNTPVVIEIDHVSVLLGWRPVTGALTYELQMQEGDEDGEWKSLSSGIQGTNIRKKNLIEGVLYQFRVRCKLATGWDDFSSSTGIQVLPTTTLQLSPPTLLTKDTTSVTLHWSPPDDSELELEGYRLRYRAEDSLEWTYVDTTLKNTQVKKKSLAVGVNYYFSVCPVLLAAPAPSSQSKGGQRKPRQKSLLCSSSAPSPPPARCSSSLHTWRSCFLTSW